MYHLTNKAELDESLCVRQDAWPRILGLAVQHGWEPIGTVSGPCCPCAEAINRADVEGRERPPLCKRCVDRRPGGGLHSYYGNDHQTVTTEDAEALADALHRAVAAGEPGACGLGKLSVFCRRGAFMID